MKRRSPGRCHCGNLELALETSLRPEELSLRADTCSFCRRHGARTTSDPSGHVVITVHHPEQLLRYRFGLRTADFLVCTRCGIYVEDAIVEYARRQERKRSGGATTGDRRER